MPGHATGTTRTLAALCICSGIFACAIWASAAQRDAEQKKQPPAQEPRIRVEVALASVIVSVLDASGQPLPDLPRNAFEIFEEGVAQKITIFETETRQPLDLALMVDTSASTFKEIEFERQAAIRFVRRILRANDRLSVFQFSDEVTQLSGFSADAERHAKSLQLLVTGSGTALYDAIAIGSETLNRRPSDRRRVIVLVTDAGESTSVTKFEEARRIALSSDVMLYTILIRPVKTESGRNTAGEHALINIAEATGGAMYTADLSEQLNDIFDRIERELRTQYRLGYYPEPRPPRDSYRRIEVRVKNLALGAIVRHRKGYYTD